MALRLFVSAALALAGCSSDVTELDGSVWPECPDGGVVYRDRCVDPAGLAACELIESRGGCPDGFHCDPEARTCVEGGECGDTVCAPGETCVDDRCTCGGSSCPEGQVCAPVSVGDDGRVVGGCVPLAHDGDGDGAPAGDLDGDGRPDDCDDLDAAVRPGADEVCDGKDNDCDGGVDEGFDEDGDGYTTCGTAFYGPDCDDASAAIGPGAVDLCALGPDGTHIESDCDETRNSCPPGSDCCPRVEGCVDLTSSHESCGSCGHACAETETCVVGVCRSSVGEVEPDPDEGEVEVPADEGTSNHPDIAWNWMRGSEWFSFRSGRSWSWYEFYYWELDYGIAWVQKVGDRGLLMFTGRHFLSSPISPISEVAGSVSGFLSPLQSLRWYDTVVVDFLEGEDTILSLAPSGGLGYGLVWTDGSGSSQVQFAALGSYGTLTGWSQQVTHGSSNHLYPRLSFSPYYYFMGSGYGLVYQREDDDDVQVYFQQVQSYWDWWAPIDIAFRVSSDPEGAFTPDVAYSPYGHGVVWVGAAENDLYFALVGSFGGNIIPPQRITLDNSVVPVRPSICWNEAAGEFAVAYQATSPPTENQDIYFVRISPYGWPIAAPTRLTSDPELQRSPDMAFTGDGYGVVWYDRQTGTNEIAFALLEDDGTIADGPTLLTSHGGGGEATNPAVTFAGASDALGGSVFGLAGWVGDELRGNGEFGLIWRDQPAADSDARVHFLRLVRD